MTLTAEQLAAALRLGSTDEETAEATRLLAFSTEAVARHAPGAPDVAHNEAAIRAAGYLFDMPLAGRGAGYADVLRNSGALAVLAPYRVHRAGSTGETPTTETPTPAGLRQTGEEAVTVATAGRWAATGLPYPAGVVFGVQVDEAPIDLGQAADLLDSSVAAGGDAGAALGMSPYALAASSEGGVIYFASSTTGTFTVRVFEHA